MRGFEELYKELITKEGHKFLGFFRSDELRFLEELLSTDLGVSVREVKGRQPRSARPFIGWFDGEILNLCFLTRNKRNLSVDIKNCKRVDKKCNWIRVFGYVLFDHLKKGYFRYTLKAVKPEYVLCGRCDDLEFLEKLKVFEI
ncbi:hypothetical protein BCF55_0963 [Hydrogenivirga caldilitoris]|uniref:Uncharacterized protein n=1 Tax=Hydrogenivirga caldilitoris TaxID=246264 RepID=A0A497XU67_9AQUI|nr:hypothetical protein [Hydrogenivirga caldilitoris]RLJ70682.1 hypothetical protein BCF55_0963 [Hydrogenivirga caldilitoris]